MLDVTFKLFKMAFTLFLFISATALIIIIPFVISYFISYIKISKGTKKIKNEFENEEIKESNIKKILIDFPYRLASDYIMRDPNEFREHGIICFIGEQGSGKSISCIDYVLRLKHKYPKMRFLSNTPCKFADQIINDPSDFIGHHNGKYGMVVLLDEAQNWFNSAESRNFPPEALSDICQERKQHKHVIITCQRFNRLASALREQVSLYVKPITLLGCLTIVNIYKPKIKEFEAEIKELKKIRSYFFVHSDYLRGTFDTLKTIEHISMKGWKPRSEHIKNDNLDK